MYHNTNQIIDELCSLRDVILGQNMKNSQHFSKFSPIFTFTTENIGAYLDQMKVENAKLLVPCASGDHALEAISKGADSIEFFDINAYSYHMARLKIAAVKALTKEEYINFFVTTNDEDMCNDDVFNYKSYEKTRKYLPKYSCNFWDQVFKYNAILRYKKLLITDTDLFIGFNNNSKTVRKLLHYLQDDNYEILKEKIHKLDENNIEFYNCCVTSLAEKIKNKSYDIILLSNIQDYINEVYGTWHLETAINRYRKYIENELYPLLNKGGIIASEYYYYYDILSKRLPLPNQEVITVPAVYDIGKEESIPAYDKVFIYKK